MAPIGAIGLHASYRRKQVLAVAQRMVEGMRSRDTALLRSVFDTSARRVSARQAVVWTSSPDGFIHAIVSADIAHLRAMYDFQVKAK